MENISTETRQFNNTRFYYTRRQRSADSVQCREDPDIRVGLSRSKGVGYMRWKDDLLQRNNSKLYNFSIFHSHSRNRPLLPGSGNHAHISRQSNTFITPRLRDDVTMIQSPAAMNYA